MALAILLVGRIDDLRTEAVRSSSTDSVAEPREAFVAIEPFEFKPVSAAIEGQIRSALEGDVQAAEAIRAVEVRRVLEGDRLVGFVAAAAISPDVFADPSFEEDVLRGLEDASGESSVEASVAGSAVYTVSAEDGVVTVFFQEGVVVFVYPRNVRSGLGIAEAMIAASEP